MARGAMKDTLKDLGITVPSVELVVTDRMGIHGELVSLPDFVEKYTEKILDNMAGILGMKECQGCTYYGKPSDAPDSVGKDCMYEMVREEDEPIEPPCKREK